MQDPVDDMSNYKLGIFYYNNQDSRVIVPKKIRWMGWTFNFAKPTAYFLLALIFVIIFATKFL
jgi:uncharacterized membrane protein